MCRKGYTSTNVLGVVDHDGRFLAVYPGAEGCASDGFVFRLCSQFWTKIPAANFYLGDAGFTLSKNVLTPYRGTRYHLREWAPEAEGRPQNPKELFNYRHSKRRIGVEQTFGMWKRLFGVLNKPLELNLARVNFVVHCTAALLNYIKLCHISCIEDDEASSDDPRDRDEWEQAQGLDDPITVADTWRDSLAEEMWQEYQLYLGRED